MTKRYWINHLKEYIFTPTAPANDTTSQTGTFKAMVERLQNRVAQVKGVPWYQDAPTDLSTTATHIAQGSSAHGGVLEKLQKDGVDITKQRAVNFTGPGVTVSDDGANGRTNVDIPGGGGGGGGGSAHIIQEEGATQTARSRLNFRGVGATASDDSGNDRTNVDIRGNVTRSGTAPTSPVAGELWADTTTTPETLRVYTGGAWNPTSGVPTDSSVTNIKVAAAAGIDKSKLGPLAIDTADLVTNRTLLITCTSGTRPSSPPTGQGIYETDSQQVRVNTGTSGSPVWTSITATQTYQDPAFISGLTLTWDAANTLGIESGAAYIPSSSSVLTATSRLTRPVTFSASATNWYFVYLFDNGGSPDILISSDPPATPYTGLARTKGAGSTAASTAHRYLGAILPNGASTPVMFKWAWHANNRIDWLTNTSASPFLVMTGGAGFNSTTETSVNCSAVVPPTSKRATLDIAHRSTNPVLFGNSEDGVNLASGEAVRRMWEVPSNGQLAHQVFDMPLDSNQQFTYRWTGTPGGLALYGGPVGYYEQR